GGSLRADVPAGRTAGRLPGAMGLLGAIVWTLIVGLFIGGLGRLAVPGYQPLGCFGTILVCIGGSVIGTVVAAILDLRRGCYPLFEVLGAALLVWLITRSRRPRAY